jgi:RNA polymerase sigma-70 factor (ECF subfamily)
MELSKHNKQNLQRKSVMQNEINLIKACIKGDKKSQKQLYEQYSKRLFVVCLRYTKGRLDAEDVLQESFIKAFANLTNFRHDCPLEAWLKRIVVNTALKHNRSKLYTFPPEDVGEMSDLLPDNELTISNFSLKELLELIQKLPLRCQLVFNMYAIEGYQHLEIAELLEISEGTSKSQYSRAKTLLQAMIAQREEVHYVSL